MKTIDELKLLREHARLQVENLELRAALIVLKRERLEQEVSQLTAQIAAYEAVQGRPGVQIPEIPPSGCKATPTGVGGSGEE